MLKEHGFEVTEAITYNSMPPQDFSIELLANFSRLNLALFFSANSLANFLALAYKNKSSLKYLRFLCLSRKVAARLENVKTKAVYIADTSDLNGMINKIDEIY